MSIIKPRYIQRTKERDLKFPIPAYFSRKFSLITVNSQPPPLHLLHIIPAHPPPSYKASLPALPDRSLGAQTGKRTHLHLQHLIHYQPPPTPTLQLQPPSSSSLKREKETKKPQGKTKRKNPIDIYTLDQEYIYITHLQLTAPPETTSHRKPRKSDVRSKLL